MPLIAGGYLVARSGGSLPLMIVTGLAGILIGDSVIFRAGQTYGEKLLETRLGRHIPGERVQRIVCLFEKHGSKFIMVARFVPGLRAVTYFVAGTTGVPYWKFLLFDGLAACISAPAWVALGWWGHKHHMINRAMKYAQRAQVGILAGFLVTAGIYALVLLLRRRARKQRSLLATTPPPLRAVLTPEEDRAAAARRT